MSYFISIFHRPLDRSKLNYFVVVVVAVVVVVVVVAQCNIIFQDKNLSGDEEIKQQSSKSIKQENGEGFYEESTTL